jgi:hypothetical protein
MRTIVVKATQQMVTVNTPQGDATGTTIERCLAQILPQAPPAMLHGASEILESLLGPLDHSEVRTGVVDA